MPEKFLIYNAMGMWEEVTASAFLTGTVGQKTKSYFIRDPKFKVIEFGLLDDRGKVYRPYGRIMFKNETT